VELSHVKNNRSVAMLCLNIKPMIGTIQYCFFSAHLIPSRKDVIPYDAMIRLFLNALNNCYNSPHIEKHSELLPKNIILFRGGLPDNRFGELYSKEVVAVQRAVRIFTDEIGKKDKKIGKWRPKINFLVVNKSILDRFGIVDEMQSYRSVNSPCVIMDDITSNRLFDFILWPYHPKKEENKTKPVRYIVLKDDMKISEDPGACLDMFQYIYSLCYCFVFAIPFPLGNTSNPSVLVYAKRYAESFGQIIFEQDRSLKALARSRYLINRPDLVHPVKINSDTD